MTVKANAKINLTLEVYARRPDGYHALRSLVVPVSLADTLEIEPADDDKIMSDTGFPDDLCVRAARELADCSDCPIVHGRRCGVRIHVEKRIPIGGGLGGGSADAAAVLRALNELWRLGKSPEKLAQIGAAVGSDVPALVLAQHYRQAVLMEGRGEKVTLARKADDRLCAIEQLSNPVNRTMPLVLANPGISVSTPEIFRLCTPRTEQAQAPVNDLQEPAIRRHPEIARTLDALCSAGATDVRMSGSGATCFGFASDEASAVCIAETLAQAGFLSWPAQLIVQ